MPLHKKIIELTGSLCQLFNPRSSSPSSRGQEVRFVEVTKLFSLRQQKSQFQQRRQGQKDPKQVKTCFTTPTASATSTTSATIFSVSNRGTSNRSWRGCWRGPTYFETVGKTLNFGLILLKCCTLGSTITLLTRSKSRWNNKRDDHCYKSDYILIDLVWYHMVFIGNGDRLINIGYNCGID